VSDVRHKTKDEQQHGEAEPDKPGLLEVMVVEHRREHAADNPDAEIHRLPLHEIARVAMAFRRKRRGAREHHKAEHDQAKHRQHEQVDAVSVDVQ
jgi:hypothetical protein